MNIPIAGKEYKLISTDQEGIYIDYTDPNLPCIYAHALLSISDVVQYVKEYQPDKRIFIPEQLPILEYIKVSIFDQVYPVKIHRTGKQKSFLKNSIIHYFIPKNADITKPTFLSRIKDDFFEDSIIGMLSNWEEQLQLMSNDIVFKKLKTRPFIVDLVTQNICFNKNNQLLSLRTNEFIVYLALQALQTTLEDSLKSAPQYFPDYERLLKTIHHEFTRI